MGGVILIAGPDGTGKSTVARALLERAGASGPTLHIHCRPNVLKRKRDPKKAARAHRNPQGEPAYPRWLSALKRCALALDYVLGWRLRVRPIVREGGWVVLERGFWDTIVDPKRYRLRPPGWLTRWLWRIVPTPDVALILEAPVPTIRARKQDLSAPELARQMATWREIDRAAKRSVRIDTSRPVPDVIGAALSATGL